MIKSLLERTFILCVFFILAGCSEPSPESTDLAEQPEMPILTLNELLSADDVQERLALAAKTVDDRILVEMQEILLDAAREVHLSEKEIELLSGRQGLIFLEYQGLRINFNREFEDAFFNFKAVSPIYARYPAFEQLKAETEELIKNRDRLIGSIEQDLISNGVTDNVQVQARQVWRQLMKEQGIETLNLQ